MSDQTKEPSGSPFPEIPKAPEAPTPDFQPLIDGLKERPDTHFPPRNQAVPAGSGVPKPAELDQDPGGGYRSNRTFPQT